MRRLLMMGALAAPLGANAAELVFEGHYRARGQFFNSLSLADTQANENAEGSALLIDHRLRLQPGFLLSDKVALFTQIDILPYVLWGDEPILRDDNDPSPDDTPPVVLSPGVQPPTTEDGASTLTNLRATRVWGEVQTPYGQLRFGRMPFEWGAGMVWNAGNQPWQEFGDTVDRIQFTTRADQIYIMGGLETNAEQFVNEADDVFGVTGSILYATEQASVGVYGLHRRTNDRDEETRFTLTTVDIWADAAAGPLNIEAEFAGQFGGGALSEDIDDAQVLAFGGMIDVGMNIDKIRLGLSGGFATGDTDPTDNDFRTFTFDPDFNQTLFLFEEPMPTLTPTVATDANQGRTLDAARTGYALSNAFYGRPRVGYQILDDLTADVSFFIAQAAAVPEADDNNRSYGSEINARIIYTPFEHFTVDGLFGAFIPGRYYSSFTDTDLGGNFDQTAFGGQLIGTVHF